MTGLLRARDVDQDLQTITVGITAPDFNLMSADHKPVRLSDYRGKKNVLIFFMRAFHCIQCRDYARRLAEASTDLATRDTVTLIIGPGTRQDAEKLNRTINANGGAIIANDGTGAVYDDYILHKVFFSLIQKSATFVVDKMGMVQYAVATANANRWLSAKVLDQVRKTLDTIQAEQRPA